MPLQKADQAAPELPAAPDFGDAVPEAPSMDNGFDSPAEPSMPMAQAAPSAPVSSETKAPTEAKDFGSKPKSQDTFVKFSFGEGQKEYWLKQTHIHEKNIREFSAAGFTAYYHPRDAFIFVYKTADAQNYLKGFRDPEQKKGVVARISVAYTKASTPDNPKTWVGCLCDPDGLYEDNGQMKSNATKVFAGIVGKDSNEVKNLMLANSERLAAGRNQNSAPGVPSGAPAAPQQSAQTPSQPAPALVPDADLNFGFSM